LKATKYIDTEFFIFRSDEIVQEHKQFNDDSNNLECWLKEAENKGSEITRLLPGGSNNVTDVNKATQLLLVGSRNNPK